ncbi:LysR family transcriptional regulator [Marmoricola endophyticus]|uniref:LysR family transcriptional regulator n=1 Tax=Marmoricola endophyticus TaxID=2040280 RepID=A0A917BTD3_9ACTN|nr:LysR family transcriptional regulator [Marmoricola endophyticus]GGF53737.1 LysR family transcriptional regulator [Marmoricola endophyticus]
MIDLDALVSLRAVSTHGSVSAAADALGFTPSAVSQQVKRLERQVGLALLERVGRGVILTDTGRRLVTSGGSLLQDLERVESDLHHAAGSVSGVLRIATFSTAVRGLVAPALGPVVRTHPDLRLKITEHEPWDAVARVADGRADLGVVHSWGDVPISVPEHLDSREIARDVADVVVPAGHALAERRRVRPADLVEVEWIATPEGTICRQWLDRMYVGTGRTPRIAHVSMEFDSHLALVEAGLGIALVPRLGRAPLADGVRALEAHDPVPTRTVTALHRRSMKDSPAVLAVLDALSRTAAPPSAR